MMSSLLVASDDSDVPDLDLRPQRSRRLFNKSSRHSPRCEWNVSAFYCLFLCSLSVCVIYLAIISYKLTKRLDELNETVADLVLLPPRITVLQNDLHRLSMEFDLTREAENYNLNNTRTTEYVYDTIERFRQDMEEVKRKVEKTWHSSQDVVHRVSTMEQRCFSVCQLHRTRDKEKQRRRQADKPLNIHDEIVFKRTG